MNFGESLLGALLGAAVGSFLGYIGSYFLAKHSRREDVVERRKRLMRALAHEIPLEIKDITWGSVPGRLTLSTGVYLSALTPLIDLAADLDNDHLLQALAHLRSRSDSFNDVVGWINPLQTHPMTPDELAGFMSMAQESYQEVKDAAAIVIPMLEIRR